MYLDTLVGETDFLKANKTRSADSQRPTTRWDAAEMISKEFRFLCAVGLETVTCESYAELKSEKEGHT